MKELNKIKADLRDIRFYYANRELLDESFGDIGTNRIMETVKMYNAAVCLISPRLYEVYVCLYIKGKTQAAYAREHGYTSEYVQSIHVMLLKALQQELSKKGGTL